MCISYAIYFYIFIFLRGHIKKKGMLSVDVKSHYIPWLTYPFIDYIENLDLSNCNVFEYGAGSSTFWWAGKVNQVTSVEMELNWFEFLKNKLPHNSILSLCTNGAEYPLTINEQKECFDIIIVDGAERYRCAKAAMSKLSVRGLIILDNSDWYPNSALLLRDNNFVQLDFYGFSPNNSFPTTTSLFFKSDELLKRRLKAQHPVIGGNKILGGALDDRGN